MLRKIDAPEIMSIYELGRKYPDNYIMAVITETVDTQSNDLGYAIYLADTYDELFDVPKADREGKQCRRFSGYSAEKTLSLGLAAYV